MTATPAQAARTAPDGRPASPVAASSPSAAATARTPPDDSSAGRPASKVAGRARENWRASYRQPAPLRPDLQTVGPPHHFPTAASQPPSVPSPGRKKGFPPSNDRKSSPLGRSPRDPAGDG